MPGMTPEERALLDNLTDVPSPSEIPDDAMTNARIARAAVEGRISRTLEGARPKQCRGQKVPVTVPEAAPCPPGTY